MGTTVTFKPYGILLEVEPQINADGSVSGIVRAEVSQIDPSVSVQNIPGFLTRRTEADFYSTSGQAVVLSGLYSMELGEDTTKVPLLGDIPLLKALFSSTAENRKSSELVVFIVPHLHSANASRNRQILNTTNAVFDEQSRKLRGDETDVLTKLKPSPQIWGLEAMENTLNKPGSWDLESIETVPPGSVKDKGSADKPRDGAGQ
jgi:pilus assembly protein CpaC